MVCVSWAPSDGVLGQGINRVNGLGQVIEAQEGLV